MYQNYPLALILYQNYVYANLAFHTAVDEITHLFRDLNMD